jgi:hypothetical protein
VGLFPSLKLDTDGNPVVSYYDATNADLRVLHCNDPACTTGGDSIVSADTNGSAGLYSSLALDSSGLPVVSYFDYSAGDVNIIRCGDSNCSAGNTITAPDGPDFVGEWTAVTLQSGDIPVVAYYDFTNRDLKVTRCGDPACSSNNTVSVLETTGDTGWNSSVQLNSSGNPVIAFHNWTESDVRLAVCNDPACSGGDDSISAIDLASSAGLYASLQLNSLGHPVITYYDIGSSALKVLRCNDPLCSGTGESIAVPDSVGDVGRATSLALDENDIPTVTYVDSTNGNLKVLKCGNTLCTLGNVISTPDNSGTIGTHTSLALNADGEPVVAYYDAASGDLKILHCGDPACAGGGVGGLTELSARDYAVARAPWFQLGLLLLIGFTLLVGAWGACE